MYLKINIIQTDSQKKWLKDTELSRFALRVVVDF